ncbi:Desaturase, partial [Operophtera brumata]
MKYYLTDSSYQKLVTKYVIQYQMEKLKWTKLKYPSLRDNGLRDPVQRLEGKGMDDGAEGLWRVRDKLYGLTSFLKRLPPLVKNGLGLL